MKNTKSIGDLGEQIACEYLEKIGFEILFRNYRSRFGEIDIIAKDGEFLAFIEVKKRKTKNFGSGAEYVSLKKQEKIIKTALMFLTEYTYELQPRFDVLEVNKEEINLLKNAFEHI